MNPDQLKELVRSIVERSQDLRDEFTSEHNAPVNYAAVFAQDESEFQELIEVVKSLGEILEDTPTGPLFKIQPLDTVAGELQLLKIRKPDPQRPERGDADFTVAAYQQFKDQYLVRPGFRLIKRDKFEMVELSHPTFEVLAYFSYPPLDKQYGLK